MRRRGAITWSKRILMFLVISAVLSLTSTQFAVFAQFPDPFVNLNNWTIVSGTPQIDSSLIAQRAPSLKMGDKIDGDSTFGKGADSLYLKNPITTNFQDGTVDFDIFFDPGGGTKAVITFRMQDPDRYYGALLSNTQNWSSTFVIVSSGHVQAIGIGSPPQEFPTGTWSHVILQINGPHFTCMIGGQPVFSANDTTWNDGKWGGVGIYSQYYDGVFHLDNFGIENTSNPLTYVSPFTSNVTNIVTSTRSSYTTITSIQTIVNPVISNVVSYNTTFVSAYVPMMDYPTLSFLLIVGFLIGAIDIHEYEKSAMAVLATVISAFVIAYGFYLQERILPYLGLFATTLIAGILVKLVRRQLKQKYDNT